MVPLAGRAGEGRLVRKRGCAKLSSVVHDFGGAEFVELLYFGCGEGAIVDADVVDTHRGTICLFASRE
jgi:hypothetical protein